MDFKDPEAAKKGPALQHWSPRSLTKKTSHASRKTCYLAESNPKLLSVGTWEPRPCWARAKARDSYSSSCRRTTRMTTFRSMKTRQVTHSILLNKKKCSFPGWVVDPNSLYFVTDPEICPNLDPVPDPSLFTKLTWSILTKTENILWLTIFPLKKCVFKKLKKCMKKVMN